MSEEGQEAENDAVVATYNRLIELALNEDRLASERTNIFLLASSFLVVGFVSTMVVSSIPQIVSQILGGVGIALCILYFFSINFTWRTLRFWQKLITDEIEAVKLPSYFRSQRLVPYSLRKKHYKDSAWLKIVSKLKLGPIEVSGYWMPSLFLIMWVLLLTLGVSSV